MRGENLFELAANTDPVALSPDTRYHITIYVNSGATSIFSMVNHLGTDPADTDGRRFKTTLERGLVQQGNNQWGLTFSHAALRLSIGGRTVDFTDLVIRGNDNPIGMWSPDGSDPVGGSVELIAGICLRPVR